MDRGLRQRIACLLRTDRDCKSRRRTPSSLSRSWRPIRKSMVMASCLRIHGAPPYGNILHWLPWNTSLLAADLSNALTNAPMGQWTRQASRSRRPRGYRQTSPYGAQRDAAEVTDKDMGFFRPPSKERTEPPLQLCIHINFAER